MTQPVDFYILNAFCKGPFTGNPAAVVPLEAWLKDEQMQAIATQFNFAETAFFVERNEAGHYDLRWFTPACEVDLCGHATLATAALVLDELAIGLEAVRFHTHSGELPVSRAGDGYALDFPALPATPAEPSSDLAEGLGARASAYLTGAMQLAVFEHADQVRALTPDMAKLARIPHGVIATAPGEHGVDFVSRYFAPAEGIPEDPATGSAHCLLAPYWAARLGKDRLIARQLSARGGWLEVAVAGDRVTLVGHTQSFAEGRLFV